MSNLNTIKITCLCIILLSEFHVTKLKHLAGPSPFQRQRWWSCGPLPRKVVAMLFVAMEMGGLAEQCSIYVLLSKTHSTV